MIAITRVKQAVNEFVKVLRYGRSDIKTAEYVNPAGIESKPVKDDIAVHAETSSDSLTVCLGYIRPSETVKPGETLIYSTDSDGVRVFEMYFKNDGTIEIGGNTENAVFYSALNSGLQTFINDLNAKLVTAFSAVGGSWPGTSLDITDSKNDDVKL